MCSLKKNIHTLSLSNELFLTLYSAFAQAESESISENVKAGVRMKMKRGKLVGSMHLLVLFMIKKKI